MLDNIITWIVRVDKQDIRPPRVRVEVRPESLSNRTLSFGAVYLESEGYFSYFVIPWGKDLRGRSKQRVYACMYNVTCS